MSNNHDHEEHEELLDELADLRKKKAPDATPAVGLILVILILMGAGWFGGGVNHQNKDDETETGPFVAAECKRSGCNNELCIAADESISSTCEYKEEYACYSEENTRCEVQDDGECGWTQTDELTQCIAES